VNIRVSPSRTSSRGVCAHHSPSLVWRWSVTRVQRLRQLHLFEIGADHRSVVDLSPLIFVYGIDPSGLMDSSACVFGNGARSWRGSGIRRWPGLSHIRTGIFKAIFYANRSSTQGSNWPLNPMATECVRGQDPRPKSALLHAFIRISSSQVCVRLSRCIARSAPSAMPTGCSR